MSAKIVSSSLFQSAVLQSSAQNKHLMSFTGEEEAHHSIQIQLLQNIERQKQKMTQQLITILAEEQKLNINSLQPLKNQQQKTQQVKIQSGENLQVQQQRQLLKGQEAQNKPLEQENARQGKKRASNQQQSQDVQQKIPKPEEEKNEHASQLLLLKQKIKEYIQRLQSLKCRTLNVKNNIQVNALKEKFVQINIYIKNETQMTEVLLEKEKQREDQLRKYLKELYELARVIGQFLVVNQELYHLTEEKEHIRKQLNIFQTRESQLKKNKQNYQVQVGKVLEQLQSESHQLLSVLEKQAQKNQQLQKEITKRKEKVKKFTQNQRKLYQNVQKLKKQISEAELIKAQQKIKLTQKQQKTKKNATYSQNPNKTDQAPPLGGSSIIVSPQMRPSSSISSEYQATLSPANQMVNQYYYEVKRSLIDEIKANSLFIGALTVLSYSAITFV